jgi:hypothetical protein
MIAAEMKGTDMNQAVYYLERTFFQNRFSDNCEIFLARS